MSSTQNYNLFKFEDNNTADLRLQNLSMDIIDSKLYELNTNIVQANNKIDNIKIADASLTQKGIVKLNNTVTSTSNSEASTPNAVKQAYDKAVQAFQSASDGKTYITGKLGNTNVNNTFTQIGDEIQNCKNIISNNLVQKGVYANNNFDLRNLASLVESLGQYKIISGTNTTLQKAGTYAETLDFTGQFPKKPILLVIYNHTMAFTGSGIFNLSAWFNGKASPDEWVIRGGLDTDPSYIITVGSNWEDIDRYLTLNWSAIVPV